METTKELSNCETENIYSDIIEFDLGTEVEKLKEENGLLEDHIDSLKKDIEKLADALQQLKVIQKNLAENISSLFLTAKMELTRKDHIIDNLQRDLNDIIFRRDKKKRKSLCNSPVNVNLSKRRRYDNSYNSTDHMNYINENYQNNIRYSGDEDSEKVGRENELKNEYNIDWGSRVKCHKYDEDDVHTEYENTARFQPKSYRQNMVDRLKLQYREESRSSNHGRYHSRDRNDDSYRNRRYVMNSPSTDYKEHWIDKSNRKSSLKTEEEFGKCSSDNEQDIQKECSRIPKIKTIKLEKEPIKEESNKRKTENKKPVRKKLLVVQKLERELMEKRALTSQHPSVDLSRNEAKKNKNRRGNYFVDHMDHIMDTVLLDMNQAKIISGNCNSYSEHIKNSTINTHKQLPSFENVQINSHNVSSELTDIKKGREKKKLVSCDEVNYNLPSSKTDSEIVSEAMKRTKNENNIKDEGKTNKIIDVNNDIAPVNELPVQSGHEKIKNWYLLGRKSDQVIEDELNLHKENFTKIENGHFEHKNISKGGSNQENWKNHHLINNSSIEMKIDQKLSQISNREISGTDSDECVRKNNCSESLCDRLERHLEKKERNDISEISKFTEAGNDKYMDLLKNQKDGVQYTSQDSETTRKTTDTSGKGDKQPTHNNTDTETGTSLPKESQETKPLSKRKLTPSPTLPKFNSQYKIPKKVKKILEGEPSEKNNADSKAPRNLVLLSTEDHKISYERTHKDTDSKSENFRRGRRKSVPRSFLRQRLEETHESIRSKSRERYSRGNSGERQTKTGKQYYNRYRIDYQSENYNRIKNLSRENFEGQERRSRNREEEQMISEKNNIVDIKHSRIEKRNDSNFENTDTSQLPEIEASLYSQRRRKKHNYLVMKYSERIHNNINKKDHQTIILEKDNDLDRDTIHPKNENITEHKELSETINNVTGFNYSVDGSSRTISKKDSYGESPEKIPAKQEINATTIENYAKIPDNFTKKNIQNTDSKIIEGKFPHKNIVTSIKDSLNNSDIKNRLEATSLETTEELYAVNSREKVNTTDSLNEMFLKPGSSKIMKDAIDESDVVEEKLGNAAENSSEKKNLENGKLSIGNISKYSLKTNSTKKDLKELRTAPSIEERELKATENTKRRNMPDIFSQEVCGQIISHLIPLKQTLPTEQHLEDSVTAEKIKLPDKFTICYNSVRKELADNKQVDEVTEEKEKQSPLSETDSLKVLTKVEKSLDILVGIKNSEKEKTHCNLVFPSSSKPNADDSNIPFIAVRSSYQETIESSPLPAQTLVRKRITPIRVDDTPLCSFENILVKNRMPSFAKDFTASNGSPLSLTHGGDIPLLHLEENNFHISNDDGTQKSFDRNIMNLLDSMNMSNLECDITKFQDSSEKDDRCRNVSNSGPKDKSDGEVLKPSIEKQTLAPVAKSDAKLTPSTEPLVTSTPVDTNDCKNECKSVNGVQNSYGDLRTTTSNSKQNLSMIGKRRSVRLVVINSV